MSLLWGQGFAFSSAISNNHGHRLPVTKSVQSLGRRQYHLIRQCREAGPLRQQPFEVNQTHDLAGIGVNLRNAIALPQVSPNLPLPTRAH